MTITFTVAPETPPDRVDRWLAETLLSHSHSPDASQNASTAHITQATAGDIISRSRIKALILEGQITRNGKIINDPSVKITPNDTYIITIPPLMPAVPQAQDIPLNVLFEDEHIIIIDKPVGLVTHPAPGNPDGTLVNALINHCGDGLTGIGGQKRPGIVHRLDKETSGVMVAAKSSRAHQRLTVMFSDHDLERVYTAVVWGVPTERSQTIDAPIGRSTQNRKKMAISEKGRGAITHVQFTRTLPPLLSVAECRLETGRTHQIRVHLAGIGHSVVGDSVYGRPPRSGQMPDNALKHALASARSFPRQALHAGELGFNHPVTGEKMAFTSPLPQDMADLVSEMQAALELRGTSLKGKGYQR